MTRTSIYCIVLITLLSACSDTINPASSGAGTTVVDSGSNSEDSSLQTGDAGGDPTDQTGDIPQSDATTGTDLVAGDSAEDQAGDGVGDSDDLYDSGDDIGEGDLDAVADGSDASADSDGATADMTADAADTVDDSDGPLCSVGCFTDQEDPSAGPTRPVAVACNVCRPAVDASGGEGFPGGCGADADCCDGDNGRCVWGRGGPFCSYDRCFEDSDCEEDQLCACNGARDGGNACIEAGCHTDQECGDYKCTPSLGSCGHYSPPVGYYCHTAADDCQSDDDCEVGDCRYFELPQPHWACSDLECLG